MNIYGDIRTCTKCNARADIVEKGKDYCADSYSLTVWKMPLSKVDEKVGKQLKSDRFG